MSNHQSAVPVAAPPRLFPPLIPLALATLGLLLAMMIFGPVREIRLGRFPR